MNDKPKVSFVLIAYNQDKYIEEAIEGAFSQTYSPLEIILSDDNSCDSTFQIMREKVRTYKGRHHVSIRQNKTNLGLAQHFNSAVSLASGEIIVVASGDDISLPERTTNTVELLTRNPGITFVSFMDIHIDQHGKELFRPRENQADKEIEVSLSDYLSFKPTSFSGASRGFLKEIYDVFGPLRSTCPTEDTPYILRGLFMGNALVSAVPGIKYRKHDHNLSAPTSLPNLPIEEIRDQYLTDTDLAADKGLISEVCKVRVLNWIERNHYRRRIRNEVSSEGFRAAYFFKKILLSSSFSMFEKLVMLRNALSTEKNEGNF